MLVDGQEVRVPMDQVEEGATVVVYAGEMIPVDGEVTIGEATVDQHALTGESRPVEKSAGSSVLAATTVISGQLQLRVEKAGQDSIAAQITDVLNQTASHHTTIESQTVNLVNRVIPYRLGLGVIAYPIAGMGGSLAILMCSFGGSMRILGSLSVLNYLNIASRTSILIKDGRSLELLPQINTVVFDKTGTLTTEQPHVAAIYPVNGYTVNQLLAYAASAEYKQTHPIARAIVDHAKAVPVHIATPDDTQFEAGFGIRTQIENVSVWVGSERFMAMAQISIPTHIQAIQATASAQGYSLVYVAVEQQLAGVLELHSTIRPEVRDLIQGLRQRGLATYIISGDHEAPTRELAQDLNIDHYYAETLPEDKARIIDELQAAGHSVCFIGDGINDGIALRKAHVSISMRGATTIATDAAQIVMMDQSLNQLIPLLDLSHEFNTNMKANYVFAVAPSVIVVSGIFLGLFSLSGATALAIPALYLGLGNAMWPLVKDRLKKNGYGANTPSCDKSSLTKLEQEESRCRHSPSYAR